MSRSTSLQKNRSEKYRTYFLYILPGFLLYIALFVFPLLLGMYYSLLDWNGFSKSYNFIGLKNYTKALGDSRFQSTIFFNFKYSLCLIICILLLSISLALLLNKKMRGRTTIRAIYFFPAVISMLTISLIFNEIYFRVLPRLGEILNIEFLEKSILSSPKTAMFGILFVHVWQGVAIPTVLFLAGLQTIPEDIMEASVLDGATKWQQFMKITIPYLLPIISVVLVLALRDGLMVFDYIIGLTTGGPGGATTSISLLIYRQGFEEMKFSFAIAESLLVSVILIVLSAIQMRFVNKRKIY